MSLEDFIWYERYRPMSLDEMVLPKMYKERFSDFIEEEDVPHLLLHGPMGSGKTTLAFILIESIPSKRLVLNASSKDRGIETMRTKVKQFAQSKAISGTLKIVFLDEADGMTPDAQRALRNTIEAYHKTCRFILTGNYLDKILPEIKSRCMMFAFSQYPKKLLFRKIRVILNAEKVKADREHIATLVDTYYPDIRTIINSLQAGSMDGAFNPALAFYLSSADLESFGDLLLEGKVRSLRQLWVGITEFSWYYKYLFDELIPELDTDEETKAGAAKIVASYLYRDSVVTDREINFTACCIDLMDVLDVDIGFTE